MKQRNNITYDRGLIVFILFPSMKYITRMILSLGMIGLGLILQYIFMNLIPGIFLVFAGTLLLLIRGVNNNISMAAYGHNVRWEKASMEQLEQIEQLHKKMRRWDRSFTDITNWMGCLPLIVICSFFLYYFAAGMEHNRAYSIMAANIVALILPWWLTGLKKIHLKPALIQKIELLRSVTNELKQHLQSFEPEYLVEFSENKEQKVIPRDIKCKLQPPNAPKEFLGMYIQISLNKVGSTSYPYAYVVLVMAQGSDIEQKTASYQPAPGLIKEYSIEQDVEVLVIRQYTTKTSGYHTKNSMVVSIVIDGIRALAKIIN